MKEFMFFDVAVIGGGPAGMIASGRAAELGARVALIERNHRPGRKLLMTGGGRCNLANSGLDKSKLVGAYGGNGKFLYSAFSRFGTSETLEFFEGLGLRLSEEDGGKVFPASGRAADVLGALMRYMEKGRVSVICGAKAEGLVREDDIKSVVLRWRQVEAGSFIICTGGVSYPATGSDGEAFRWLRGMGHTVTPLMPALSPITVREKWLSDAEGASLRDATLSAFWEGKKIADERGDIVVTRDGLSGPAAMNMSRKLAGLVREGGLKISLDFMPGTPSGKLDALVLEVLGANPNRLMKNLAEDLVSPKIAPAVMDASGIDGDTPANRLTRQERLRLVRSLKGLELSVKGLKGFEKAMVTRGGISLKEVDSKTMRSKLVPNLYFAGEALDLDGPTGGYNLQVCWTTGYIAGESAATGII